MKLALGTLALILLVAPLSAQEGASQSVTAGNSEGPANPKAQKTYKEALDFAHKNIVGFAFDDFKKADKQDGGRCFACQEGVLKFAIELQDWKAAAKAAQEMTAEAQGNAAAAVAHYELGVVLTEEGLTKRKDELFSQAHDEMTKAIAAAPDFPQAVFADGFALAHLNQDDAAKAQFGRFTKMAHPDDPNIRRAQLFMHQPGLARAGLAPAFTVTTLDGRRVSLDDFQGKVFLLDFWATRCAPCRAALPRMKEIANKFQGQPLVILSISLDDNEQAWKDFVAKNGMTWLQYRDGGFTGPVSRLFNVDAIPNTFTIDSNGVLREEHIGDASIEGEIKKLCAQAQEAQAVQSAVK